MRGPPKGLRQRDNRFDFILKRTDLFVVQIFLNEFTRHPDRGYTKTYRFSPLNYFQQIYTKTYRFSLLKFNFPISLCLRGIRTEFIRFSLLN